MNLIEQFKLDDYDVYFFKGIDIKKAQDHPNDGSGGFIFCFVDSWIDTIKKYERECKIDSILHNRKEEKFDIETLENSFLCIYQMTGNEPGLVYNMVKEKVLSKRFLPTWMPVKGLKEDGSVFKIENSKILN